MGDPIYRAPAPMLDEQYEAIAGEAMPDPQATDREALHITDARDYWPPGVTDGLTLPCACCRRKPQVDYRVDDAEWARIVPEAHQRGVVCVECFIGLGGDPTRIREIQVVGSGVTALFHPGRAYRWETDNA